MRCKYGATPDCKVHTWAKELALLRRIIKDCGVAEEAKWGMPTYTDNGKNVFMLSAFKDYASINFFKGNLIDDTSGLLSKAGENSEVSRVIRFTDTKTILKYEAEIKDILHQAIAIERAGIKTPKLKSELVLPVAISTLMKKDKNFKLAFEALTPGKQKSYVIHVNGAKQEATRVSRLEKCLPKIYAGKGFNEY
jgi:uncharacterized protein YdeI (YjbR/CyaY-like superfamily)